MINEPIRWSDQIDGSRCELPRIQNPVQKGLGCLGLFLGTIFAAWPVAVTIFFWSVRSDFAQDREFNWIDLTPLAFFGVFLFPAAIFLWFRSLLNLRGRSEIVICDKYLSVVRRWGIFKSRRRCRLSRLDGFIIERPGDGIHGVNAETFAGLSMFENRSSLVAKHSGGKSLYLVRSYPDAIVEELIEAVPPRVQRVAARAGIEVESDVFRSQNLSRGDSEGSVDSTVTRTDSSGEFSENRFAATERAHATVSSPPPGSPLVLSETADGLTIEQPKRGYLGSTTQVGRLVFYFFTFVQLVLSGGLVPALLAGKVQGSPSAGWVIFAVFTCFWIIGVVYLFYAASLHCSISLHRRLLQISESSFFGASAASWQRHEIDSVQVGVEEYTSDGSTVYDYYVKVSPVPLKEKHWFSHLTKMEIQWIVDSLHIALEIDRENGSNDV